VSQFFVIRVIKQLQKDLGLYTSPDFSLLRERNRENREIR